MEKEIVVPMAAQRDIRTVTAELNYIKRQTQDAALRGAVEIGRRLIEAKELLPHGDWGRWLSEEVDFSQSSANNLMKVAREYGPMLEAGNGGALAGLSFTKAVQLLSLPEPQRKEFVQETCVENMSTRELDAAIKDAKAKTQALEAQAIALKDAEARAKRAEKGEALAQKEQQAAEALAKRARRIAEEAEAEKKKLSQAADAAKAEAARLRDELEKAKNQPAKVERVEVAAETSELEARVKAAETRAADAEKKLVAYKPDVAAFQALFEATQKNINSMQGYILRLEGKGDGETAGKLRKALAALADAMRVNGGKAND